MCHTSMMILFRITSTRILVLACFLSAVGVSTDESSLFSEDTDPFQSTNLLDLTTSNLVSDQNLNGGDSNGFDLFFNDPDSDLFASGDLEAPSLKSIVDTTLLADCSSTNGAYLGKKARIRRGEVYGNPTLSLPTLDQLGPLQATEDPLRPKTGREIEIQAAINKVITFGYAGLYDAHYLLTYCSSDSRVCSSDNYDNIHLDDNGLTYTLTDSTGGRPFFLLLLTVEPLQKSLYTRHGSC